MCVCEENLYSFLIILLFGTGLPVITDEDLQARFWMRDCIPSPQVKERIKKIEEQRSKSKLEEAPGEMEVV